MVSDNTVVGMFGKIPKSSSNNKENGNEHPYS